MHFPPPPPIQSGLKQVKICVVTGSEPVSDQPLQASWVNKDQGIFHIRDKELFAQKWFEKKVGGSSLKIRSSFRDKSRYLYYMVTQSMLRTLKGKQFFSDLFLSYHLG